MINIKNSKKIFAAAAIGSLMAVNNIQEVYAAKNSNFDYRLKALESQVEELTADNDGLSLSSAVSIFKNTKIFGRLHIDGRWYDEDGTTDNKSDGFDIKRARLGISGDLSGDLSGDFKYKFENDFANNASKIKDAYIAYNGIDSVELKAGQFKPAFSLQKLTGSNNITFMDKSVALDSVLDRTVGFQTAAFGNNWQAAIGIFSESTGGESRADDTDYALVSRVSYAPVNNEDTLIHLGAASSISSQDRDFTDDETNNKEIDKENLVGAELALRFKSLSLQGEYIKNNIKYDNDDNITPNPSTNGNEGEFNSYYIQASLFLTGEYRPYEAKKGAFGSIKPNKPVNSGGIGAWELAARISYLDKNDDAIFEGKTDVYSLGVNWYLNKNLRLMLNYSDTQVDYAGKADNTGYKTYALRTQINF